MNFVDSFSAISSKKDVQIKDVIEKEYFVEIHIDNGISSGETKEILRSVSPSHFDIKNHNTGSIVKISKIDLPKLIPSGTAINNFEEGKILFGVDSFGPFHVKKGERFTAMIVGNPGMGKSSFFSMLLCQFLREGFGKHFIIDAKGVDYGLYRKHPNVRKVLVEKEAFLKCIKNIREELEDRAKVFREAFEVPPKNLDEYREFKIKYNRGDLPDFEDIFLWIDEAHKLFPHGVSVNRDSMKIEEAVERLMREGRAFGVNLIVSTHRIGDIGLSLRAMFKNKIIFYTSFQHMHHLGIGDVSILQKAIPGRCAFIDTENLEIRYIQAPLFSAKDALAISYEKRFREERESKEENKVEVEHGLETDK